MLADGCGGVALPLALVLLEAVVIARDSWRCIQLMEGFTYWKGVASFHLSQGACGRYRFKIFGLVS